MRESGKWIERLNNIIIKRKNGSTSTLELATEEGEIDILRWIAHHATDTVEEYTDENSMIYSAARLPILMFFIEGDHREFEPYLDLFTSVAEQYSDQIKFTWVDQNNENIRNQKKGLGLKNKDAIGIAFNLQQNRIMVYPEDIPINVLDLKQFVQDFLDGKV